jgi:iron complex outermembrane recepter protein
MNTIFSQKSKVESRKSKVESLFCMALFLITTLIFSQEKQKDSIKTTQLDEVLVTAVRVTAKTPVSFSNLTKKEMATRNLGQDIPILMTYMPSVVTTSDAGNGVGYTGIRVRGSDATKINVTINGIPYNDSESQGVFWVNMPDFASSVESLQLQRGVGTSTNGAGAFGGSLNLLTDGHSKKETAEISSGGGSFHTLKNTLKFSSGLLANHFEISGRLSAIESNGYIDRGSSNLKSYFLQGNYIGKTTLIKLLSFGGKEKTYQSWKGIDGNTLATNRRYNYVGIYTDDLGKTQFYDNQTDNYQQHHLQGHWNEKWSKNWNSNLAVHYTKGKGYYENFNEDAAPEKYGYISILPMPATDIIDQKWLDNDFYGSTFSVNYQDKRVDFIVGGGYNKYEGDHFGNVIKLGNAIQSPPKSYYSDFSTKTDGNLFAKLNYKWDEKWSAFLDLQVRTVHYKANSLSTGEVDDNFNFFNPKAGLNFNLNKENIFYFSFAKAQREPNRTDYEGGNVRPEKLNDFELGYRFAKKRIYFNANVYYMVYKDQLVLTGKLDNVGNPIRQNSGHSFRAGIELDASFKVLEKLIIRPNFTISANKNVDFIISENGILKNIGNTPIAFSPDLIAGNILSFLPAANFKLDLLSKYVSQQYMSNLNDKNSSLKDYFINDFNVSYQISGTKIFKTATINLLINNLLDVMYVSNGVDYGGGNIYYYPQAGTHFLLGLNLKF